MKKEDIKKHLSIYSIYNKRRTTINHAFASSIAPSDSYDDIKVSEAISYLGQSANSVLKCVYCEDEAQTWDHVVGLVKNNELREAFSQTEAYSNLFMELATDADAASEFINGILPSDLVKKSELIKKEENKGMVS